MKKTDYMRGAIAIATLGAFQLALIALFRIEVPEGNRDMVIYMLGQLSGFAAAGVGFYLNTSKSSQDKNHIIHGKDEQQDSA